jgi:hypothetical protein
MGNGVFVGPTGVRLQLQLLPFARSVAHLSRPLVTGCEEDQRRLLHSDLWNGKVKSRNWHAHQISGPCSPCRIGDLIQPSKDDQLYL